MPLGTPLGVGSLLRVPRKVGSSSLAPAVEEEELRVISPTPVSPTRVAVFLVRPAAAASAAAAVVAAAATAAAASGSGPVAPRGPWPPGTYMTNINLVPDVWLANLLSIL